MPLRNREFVLREAINLWGNFNRGDGVAKTNDAHESFQKSVPNPVRMVISSVGKEEEMIDERRKTNEIL